MNGNAINALEFVTPPVEAPFTNFILFTLVSHVLDEDHSISEHESILLQTLNVPKQVIVRVAAKENTNRATAHIALLGYAALIPKREPTSSNVIHLDRALLRTVPSPNGMR